MLCGCTVAISPVRSMTPITLPVSGSLTGAAAHVHAWTTSLKCSVANTCTACSAASAVPIAFVPAPPSLHSVPSAKFIESAACILTDAFPSSHSRTPFWSETTIRWRDSSALAARQERISGAITASGWTSQRADVSSASATTGATRAPEGSTPAAADRRHESAIGSRTVRASPRLEKRAGSSRKHSQALLISRARCTGAVATSMASHGFLILGPV